MFSPQDILDFWFAEAMRSKWFASTPQLDVAIRDKYEHVWEAALRGGLDGWLNSPEGCLALAIILDQLPLNMFRGTAKRFASEAKSREVARHAIDQDFDKQLDPARLAFLYMPFMHSENLADQDLSVELFEAAGLENNLRFAKHHREIVRRFGRFPHRNAILGRMSTQEELDYLNSKEAFKG
ncbi:MAG: DUF924 domain-containing protein [Hydrogenophilales bacterium]|nr:DUF924 domain-containing protein [Hydrogenophilales bacterium]